QAHAPLAISRAGVHATAEANEVPLQRSIAEAIADKKGDYFRRLAITRRDGSAVGVIVMSIQSDGSSSDMQTRCVLFVTDFTVQPAVTPDIVSDLLGLTRGEARIVAELIAGLSVPEAAIKLGISPNTARTLLARAIARTGTNSQIGLLRKIFMTFIPISDEI